MTFKIWKHPTYQHCYCEALPTPVGRFCFPALVSPKDPPPPQPGQPAGQARYETTLLFPKGDEKVEKFIKYLTAMTDEGIETFNKGRSASISGCKLFGKNGDGDLYDHEKYPYYKNCWVLVARNAQAPQIVGKDREAVEAATIKGGMQGRLVVTPLITAHGISYKLGAVQLINDDGVRFGGGARNVTDLLDELDNDSTPDIVEPSNTPEEPTTASEPVAEVTPPKAAKGKQAAVNLLA